MQGVLVTGDRHSVQYLVRVMAGMSETARAEEVPEAARAAEARAAAATAAVGRRDPGRVSSVSTLCDPPSCKPFHTM